MFGLGAGELFIIFVFALIFIGPKKLPELAKGLGKGIREFQKAKSEIMDDVNNVASDNQSVKPSEDNKVTVVKSETINDEKSKTVNDEKPEEEKS